MTENQRSTYAVTSNLQYRLRAAGALLGVSDNTMRGYADNSGFDVRRASDTNPDSPSVRIFDVPTLFNLAQWRRQQGLSKSPNTNGCPVVITVDVIKGGTGKSTTAAELALHLQFGGLRVLLIDLDTQANVTQLYGYESDLTLDEAPEYGLNEDAIVTETFANIVLPYLDRVRGALSLRAGVSVDAIKKPFGENGPHLIPADTFLSDFEQSLANAKGHRELYFRELFNEACQGKIPGLDISNYDVILFDCPPAISFCSTNALAAADIVVSPIKMDSFSIKGLTKLMSELGALDKTYKLSPELVILPTHYAPNLARIGRMQTQLNTYKANLAPCSISASEEFPKSLENYLPLSLQKPTSSAAKEYKLFAETIFAKVLKIAGGRAK